MKRRKGFYSISVVAKMFSVHQQTIRMYEKEGLISPKRTAGNTRLFSEEDVDRLEEIINLTHKMGVNLAGVEMILKLQKKIARLQNEMNKMFAQLQKQLNEESDEYKGSAKQNAAALLSLKKEKRGVLPTEVGSENAGGRKNEKKEPVVGRVEVLPGRPSPDVEQYKTKVEEAKLNDLESSTILKSSNYESSTNAMNSGAEEKRGGEEASMEDWQIEYEDKNFE